MTQKTSPETSQRMQLHVSPLTGTGFELELAPTATLSSLKEIISEKLNLSIDQQQLTFAGKQLDDAHLEHSLESLGLRDGSTISLAPTMKSGPIHIRHVPVVSTETAFLMVKQALKEASNESIKHSNGTSTASNTKPPFTIAAILGDKTIVFTVVPSDELPSTSLLSPTNNTSTCSESSIPNTPKTSDISTSPSLSSSPPSSSSLALVKRNSTMIISAPTSPSPSIPDTPKTSDISTSPSLSSSPPSSSSLALVKRNSTMTISAPTSPSPLKVDTPLDDSGNTALKQKMENLKEQMRLKKLQRESAKLSSSLSTPPSSHSVAYSLPSPSSTPTSAASLTAPENPKATFDTLTPSTATSTLTPMATATSCSSSSSSTSVVPKLPYSSPSKKPFAGLRRGFLLPKQHSSSLSSSRFSGQQANSSKNGSGNQQSMMSESANLVDGAHKKRSITADKAQRCRQCDKKLRLAGTFQCRCGHYYCQNHRFSTEHACTFDYRQMAREQLQKMNPVVSTPKINHF